MKTSRSAVISVASIALSIALFTVAHMLYRHAESLQSQPAPVVEVPTEVTPEVSSEGLSVEDKYAILEALATTTPDMSMDDRLGILAGLANNDEVVPEDDVLAGSITPTETLEPEPQEMSEADKLQQLESLTSNEEVTPEPIQ